MADNPTVLNRWSRRKHEAARATQTPAEPAPAPPELPVATPAAAAAPAVQATAMPAEPPLPPVESLTLASDFKPFLSAKVDESVKREALRKLFTDPHFNVMDGLDIYIDDYNKPDPIPPEMLRQLTSARFLKLFDDEEEEAKKGEAEPLAKAPTEREFADAPPADSVAQSSSRTGQALPPADDHADPDLRLQQDDAPGRPGPGEGSC